MQCIPDIDQSPVAPNFLPVFLWRMTESREGRRLSFIDCSMDQIQTAITTEWCDWKFNRALIERVNLGSIGHGKMVSDGEDVGGVIIHWFDQSVRDMEVQYLSHGTYITCG